SSLPRWDSVPRVGVEHTAKARGTPPWEPRDALGVHAGRRTAFPPHSLAARGATSGSGPDAGCRGRFSDPPGAVRRRTRQRRPGGGWGGWPRAGGCAAPNSRRSAPGAYAAGAPGRPASRAVPLARAESLGAIGPRVRKGVEEIAVGVLGQALQGHGPARGIPN